MLLDLIYAYLLEQKFQFPKSLQRVQCYNSTLSWRNHYIMSLYMTVRKQLEIEV